MNGNAERNLRELEVDIQVRVMQTFAPPPGHEVNGKIIKYIRYIAKLHRVQRVHGKLAKQQFTMQATGRALPWPQQQAPAPAAPVVALPRPPPGPPPRPGPNKVAAKGVFASGAGAGWDEGHGEEEEEEEEEPWEEEGHREEEEEEEYGEEEEEAAEEEEEDDHQWWRASKKSGLRTPEPTPTAVVPMAQREGAAQREAAREHSFLKWKRERHLALPPAQQRPKAPKPPRLPPPWEVKWTKIYPWLLARWMRLGAPGGESEYTLCLYARDVDGEQQADKLVDIVGARHLPASAFHQIDWGGKNATKLVELQDLEFYVPSGKQDSEEEDEEDSAFGNDVFRSYKAITVEEGGPDCVASVLSPLRACVAKVAPHALAISSRYEGRKRVAILGSALASLAEQEGSREGMRQRIVSAKSLKQVMKVMDA